MPRQCGTCTACCEGWLESARMQMFPGKPCRHLAEGHCSIYPDRPDNPCRTFDCGWKLPGSPMPEDMRPDQCGAIVVLGQDWGRWRVIRAVAAGWTIPPPTLQRLKRFALSGKMCLLYHEFEHDGGVLSRTHRVAFGPPEFVAAFRQAMEQEGAEQPNGDETGPPAFG